MTPRSLPRLRADTALRPGQPLSVEVAAPAGQAVRWRLRYHYGSPDDEQYGLVAVQWLIVTLAEGHKIELI